MGAPLIHFFEDLGPDAQATVGGKGAGLGALTRAGLPVPSHGPVLCTLNLARNLFGLNQCSLAALARRFAANNPCFGANTNAMRNKRV